MALDKKVNFTLDGQEIEDIVSALHFFDDFYADKKGSKITRAEMRKLAKKMRKIYYKEESK